MTDELRTIAEELVAQVPPGIPSSVLTPDYLDSVIAQLRAALARHAPGEALAGTVTYHVEIALTPTEKTILESKIDQIAGLTLARHDDPIFKAVEEVEQSVIDLFGRLGFALDRATRGHARAGRRAVNEHESDAVTAFRAWGLTWPKGSVYPPTPRACFEAGWDAALARHARGGEAENLRAALRRYGQHDSSCNVRREHFDEDGRLIAPSHCACGLAETLVRLETGWGIGRVVAQSAPGGEAEAGVIAAAREYVHSVTSVGRAVHRGEPEDVRRELALKADAADMALATAVMALDAARPGGNDGDSMGRADNVGALIRGGNPVRDGDAGDRVPMALAGIDAARPASGVARTEHRAGVNWLGDRSIPYCSCGWEGATSEDARGAIEQGDKHVADVRPASGDPAPTPPAEPEWSALSEPAFARDRQESPAGAKGEVERLWEALERIRDFEEVDHLEPGGNGRDVERVSCWAVEDMRQIARQALAGGAS